MNGNADLAMGSKKWLKLGLHAAIWGSPYLFNRVALDDLPPLQDLAQVPGVDRHPVRFGQPGCHLGQRPGPGAPKPTTPIWRETQTRSEPQPTPRPLTEI
jgi:hypothetical protein